MSATRDHRRKSYGQVCPLATALDVVGDRWTPLILRELLGGPARFHELEDGLPGIAKNLLTERLRRLEDDGLLRRIQSATTAQYALTERGAAVRPTLEELGMWGATLGRIGPAEHDRSIRAIAMALQAILVRAGDALPADATTIELDVDGEPLELVLGPRPTVTARPATDPEARVAVDRPTVSAYLVGQPFDPARFTVLAGDDTGRTTLLRALGALADPAPA